MILYSIACEVYETSTCSDIPCNTRACTVGVLCIPIPWLDLRWRGQSVTSVCNTKDTRQTQVLQKCWVRLAKTERCRLLCILFLDITGVSRGFSHVHAYIIVLHVYEQNALIKKKKSYSCVYNICEWIFVNRNSKITFQVYTKKHPPWMQILN